MSKPGWNLHFHHWFPQNGAWTALKPPANVLKNLHEPAFHPGFSQKGAWTAPKPPPTKKKKSPQKKRIPKTIPHPLSTGTPLITLHFLVTCFGPVVFKESIGLSIPWLKAPESCPQKLTFAPWGFITSMMPFRLKERQT